jgi:hypothetical protein
MLIPSVQYHHCAGQYATFACAPRFHINQSHTRANRPKIRAHPPIMEVEEGGENSLKQERKAGGERVRVIVQCRDSYSVAI